VQQANAACGDAIRTITRDRRAARPGTPSGRIGGHQVDLADDQVSKIAGLQPSGR